MKAAATALVGVQFALGCAVAAYAASALLLAGRPGGLSLIILLAAYVPYAGVGSILVARRPRNVIGWVLLGMGWTFAVSFLPIDATAHELQTLTASPARDGHRLADRNGRCHSRSPCSPRSLSPFRPAGSREVVGGGSPSSCWRWSGGW